MVAPNAFKTMSALVVAALLGVMPVAAQEPDNPPPAQSEPGSFGGWPPAQSDQPPAEPQPVPSEPATAPPPAAPAEAPPPAAPQPSPYVVTEAPPPAPTEQPPPPPQARQDCPEQKESKGLLRYGLPKWAAGGVAGLAVGALTGGVSALALVLLANTLIGFNVFTLPAGFPSLFLIIPIGLALGALAGAGVGAAVGQFLPMMNIFEKPCTTGAGNDPLTRPAGSSIN